MIESSLANTFVGSKHKSKAFNWHALWERKKKKSNADDYTTIYWDIHWSISKTLQDPVSRLLRMSRHPFHSDNIYFLRDSSHSHSSLQLVGFVCGLLFFFHYYWTAQLQTNLSHDKPAEWKIWDLSLWGVPSCQAPSTPHLEHGPEPEPRPQIPLLPCVA